MVRLPILAAALAAASATAGAAATAVPTGGTLSAYLDPVFGPDGSLLSWADRATLAFDTGDDLFRVGESVDFGSCDGSVPPESCSTGGTPGGEGVAGFSLSGKVDPFVSLNVSFTDFGAPSTLLVLLQVPMIGIAGGADWSLQGNLEPDGPGDSVTGALPGGGIFAGIVNGLPFGLIGSGPIAPGAGIVDFAPATGSLDCMAIDPVLGCVSQGLAFGATGGGGGGSYVASGTFTVSLPAPAPVPLPGGGPALAAALGMGLALRRARRQAQAGRYSAPDTKAYSAGG